MAKYTELTEAQKAKIPEYVERGLGYGLQTQKADYDMGRVRELVQKLYTKLGYNKLPAIHICQSPKAANKLVKELKVKAGVSTTESDGLDFDYIPGSQYLSWLYMYDFINKEVVEPADRVTDTCYEELMHLCEYIGWFWAYDTDIIISQHPVSIKMTNQRLHNPTGPAMEYTDGFKLYAINGVRFDVDIAEKFIETPVDKIAYDDVLGIKNAEQRSEIIKKIGINKLFNHLKPKKLHTADGYELYSVSVVQGVDRIYLKMQNPSIDEVHVEAVHPDCKTVQQALYWRNFGDLNDKFVKPRILT